MRKNRLLVYGPEISGFNVGLLRAVNSAGHACRVVSIGQNSFRYGIVEGSNPKSASETSHPTRPKIFWCRLEALWLSFFWADAILYISGTTPTGTFLEIKVLKLITNKRLNVLFHGSDARPPYLNGARHKEGMPIDWQKIRTQVSEIKQLIRKVELSGARVFAYPGISHFFSRPFIDWQLLGMPVAEDVKRTRASLEKGQLNPRITRVLHSPSNPEAKGTSSIRSMIAKLRAEGHEIEYQELHGVPNSEVRRAILKADIAIDQLYCDRPGAAFSLECITNGVLCIVGSNQTEWLSDHYKNVPIQPCYLIPSSEVSNVLRNLLRNPRERKTLAAELQSTARTDFSPETIGDRWLSAIFLEPSPDAYFDPNTLDHEMGGFASRSHLGELVRGVLRVHGAHALGLEHNPRLKKMVIEAFSQ